jgi:hypothetical protein
MKTGLHTWTPGSLGDLYVTLAEEALGAPIGDFPTFQKKLSEVI